jgi:hypothetical protein
MGKLPVVNHIIADNYCYLALLLFSLKATFNFTISD